MKVTDLMTRDVQTCTIHDSLNAAARIMWDHDCGCTPVVDGNGRLVGMVTDRDICMAAYTQGLPLKAIPVEHVMSAQVISCGGGDDLTAAHRLMRKHEVHRLPVADSHGRLVGILSLSDIVNCASADSAGPSEAVEIAATLSALRRRRKPAALASSVPSDTGTAPEPPKARKKAPTQRKPAIR